MTAKTETEAADGGSLGEEVDVLAVVIPVIVVVIILMIIVIIYFILRPRSKR